MSLTQPVLPKQVAVIGSGPTGLMAADVLSRQKNISVTLYEKRPALGRKLFIAGASGLNITSSLPQKELEKIYEPQPWIWGRIFEQFSRDDWLAFIHNLGLETFQGTSQRHFLKGMKARPLIKAWQEKLIRLGVDFVNKKECIDFQVCHNERSLLCLRFSDGEERKISAVCFALGGGSWEPSEDPLRWPQVFLKNRIKMQEFTPANTGFSVNWNHKFVEEAEGLPLKNIKLITPEGNKAGDLVVTRYGLEGTPIYTLGKPGPVFLDLKPDMTAEQIIDRCQKTREHLSPIRSIRKQLRLCPGSLALLYHHGNLGVEATLKSWVDILKKFPLVLGGPQPLAKAISSRGGIDLSEVSDYLMITKYPGVFVAGEMLDWHAPTGGFLIQGCVSQGYFAAQNVLSYLAQKNRPQ